MHKVEFFIVGAPKAGTTSLHYYLDKHPEINMSTIKEPNFFSSEEIIQDNLYYKDAPLINDLKDYLRLFNFDNRQINGEASVSYLFYKSVANKIKNYNKNAKIIIVLRNPIDRAFSHYTMDYTSGYFDYSFEDIIDEKFKKNEAKIYQQVLELGMYYEQVKNYYEKFDKKNILILFQEEMKNNTAQSVHKTLQFLNIEVSDEYKLDTNKQLHKHKAPRNYFFKKLYRNNNLKIFIKNFLPITLKESLKNILVKETKKESLDVKTRHKLLLYYKKDVELLSQFIGKDLSEIWDDFR